MTRSLAALSALMLSLPAPAGAQDVPTGPWPAGLTVPHIAPHACPGEGCFFERGLACADIPMHRQPGGTEISGRLSRGDGVAVLDGEVHVSAPGRVEVIRDVEREARVAAPGTSTGEYFGREATLRLATGDTLYVLNYLGEGSFAVWHEGRFYQTSIFWPWERFGAGRDFVYDGRVLSERSIAFWVNVRTDDDRTGWIEVDYSEFEMSGYMYPAEDLTCRPG